MNKIVLTLGILAVLSVMIPLAVVAVHANKDLPRCRYLVVRDCILNDLGQTCIVGTDEDVCNDIFYGYDNPNYKPGEKIK
jgi:hypothetical protein